MAPFGGFDPQQPGASPGEIDPIGNSPDTSTYYALSPGGRFPGDIWSWLEGQAAMDPAPGRQDPYRAQPDYQLGGVADWIRTHASGAGGAVLRALLNMHEASVQRGGGDANSIGNPLEAGDPYQGWSGPGAPYGPEGGPLHGLLDQGNDHLNDYDYGQNLDTPPGSDAPGKPHKGGGGDKFGPLNFQPYAGIQQHAQFVDWQPKQPFTVDNSATRFVGGAGSSSVPAVPVPARPGAGGAGATGGGRKPGGGGAGGGNKPLAPGGAKPAGGGVSANTLPADTLAALRLLFPGGDIPPEILAELTRTMGTPAAGSPGHQPTGGLPVKPMGMRAMRDGHGSGERGYDTGMLDRGTPGWTRDYTTGILNTAGMPLPTPRAQGPGQSTDDYITQLHDMGFDNESIMGMLNYDWGTGGVVRGTGPDGQDRFMFANTGNQYAPDNAPLPGALVGNGGAAGGPGSMGSWTGGGQFGSEYHATGGGGGGQGPSAGMWDFLNGNPLY